jgi:hypothetical protein
MPAIHSRRVEPDCVGSAPSPSTSFACPGRSRIGTVGVVTNEALNWL